MHRLRALIKREGWEPFAYLLYLGFLFIEPAFNGAGWKTWTLTFLSTAVFLVLYFSMWWMEHRFVSYCVFGIAALGFANYPFNTGATCFFIYAAALCGFAFPPRGALAALGLLEVGFTMQGWLLHITPWSWVFAMVLGAGIGVANIHQAQEKRANAKLRLAQEEVEHLAKVAERERIARDLHDVLGHTLSVIVLKSELASRLFDRDSNRARAEIAEVEQIAREALAEVRQAIRGYRAGSLAEEFARARATLETAGIKAECETPPVPVAIRELSPAQETVLALVIREAVTNVVRHSGAGLCCLRFQRDRNHYHLEITDNGRGGNGGEGNGLRGMRERLEAMGGTMVRDGSRGTRLIATLPVHEQQEAIA
jgi:two-component system, NarL family, sensor histidine kinase DesK